MGSDKVEMKSPASPVVVNRIDLGESVEWSSGRRKQAVSVRRYGACVVCVHGVNADAGVYATFRRLAGDIQQCTPESDNVPDARLAHTLVVPFVYGPIEVTEAAGTVGTREGASNVHIGTPGIGGVAAARSISEEFLKAYIEAGKAEAGFPPDSELRWAADAKLPLNARSWEGAMRLKCVVKQLEKLEMPISVLSHSNGTVVTLAALQSGMKLNNWILMGSCLNRDAVEHADGHTEFMKGIKMCEKVVNCRSIDDGVNVLRYGIGRYGLPGNPWQQAPGIGGPVPIHRSEVVLKNGPPPKGKLFEVTVVNTSHFSAGIPTLEDPSWWDLAWLDEDPIQVRLKAHTPGKDKRHIVDTWPEKLDVRSLLAVEDGGYPKPLRDPKLLEDIKAHACTPRDGCMFTGGRDATH